MFLRLTPIRLALSARVTLEVHLAFIHFKKVLFQTNLWHYETPTIRKMVIDSHKKEEDTTPPKIILVNFVC